MYQQFTKCIAKLECCCVFQELRIIKSHTYKKNTTSKQRHQLWRRDVEYTVAQVTKYIQVD